MEALLQVQLIKGLEIKTIWVHLPMFMLKTPTLLILLWSTIGAALMPPPQVCSLTLLGVMLPPSITDMD
jgi:hypothetical protein